MIAILFLFILILSFYLALKQPTYFVVFYLVASTKFLGFFDLGLFIFSGTELGWFSLNLITLSASFFSKRAFKISKFILPMYLTIAFLFVWGIVNPVLNNYESVTQALIASKNILFYAILFYLFGRKKSIDTFLLVHLLKYLGCYLTAILIISFVVKLAPPFYSENYEGYIDYVRVYFPTYISLSLFVFYADFLKRKLSFYKFSVTFILMMFALVLAGHFALTIGTLFCLLAIYIIWFRKTSLNYNHIIKVSVSLLTVIGIIFVSSESIRNNSINFVSAIIDGSDVSLNARDNYNKFRWEAINQSPYLGYGFIHQDAALMSRFETSQTDRFMMKLGVIDSGYVDMLISFGYIGMFVYLSIIFLYILRAFKYSLNFYLSLSISAFLFQYYLVNYIYLSSNV